MELTLREFENLNLYSNKNMEKVVGKLISESSNAALVNMFDDSLVLLDHDQGKFYTADYRFDEENLQLHLDNFEEVQLVKEEDDFRESVSEFFDDEDADATKLAETYKENVMQQEKYVNELINEAMSAKDFSEYVDYSQVKEAKENVELNSLNEDFFKKYQERLQSHPLNEIKYVDWENPITVSLVETEKKSILNSSVIEKAKSLWRRGDFKESFLEAAQSLIEESDESGLVELLEQFPSLFYLSEEDRDALFGKALISSSLREQRKEISNQIKDLLENNEDIANLKEKYIYEEEGEDEEDGDEEETDGEEAGGEEGEEEASAPELTGEQAQKMIDDLEKVKDNIDDEDMQDKIDDVIEKLQGTEEEGTQPKAVKEAVTILSM